MKERKKTKENKLKDLYIPYDLALRLKQLFFDGPVLVAYTLWKNPTLKNYTLSTHIKPGSYSKLSPVPVYENYKSSSVIIKAPTYEQSFDWLLEKSAENILIIKHKRGLSLVINDIETDSLNNYQVLDKLLEIEGV